jgi:alginate O-acetyltransferase complex protein AlgI
MLFNSTTFLVFFAVVLAAHRLPISWSAKKRNLLVASYLFYAAWNPPFVVLIWISTVADWVLARRIHDARTQGGRRALLVASLTVNLGLLAAFKYSEFLATSFAAVLAPLGIVWSPPALDIVLPVGISFYTFQTLSYTLDIYRGRLSPWPSFSDFALFVTFFPQLVAGPIVRASEFLPQLLVERLPRPRDVGWGLALLVIGLFEKVVLADAISAPVADTVFSRTADAGMIDAWIGTLAFANQIFFDFAGYSSCAIGAALMLGFALPDNFRFPYAAVGFSDFWRRWHVSLSTWLRDYLYISLGGNRGGRLRTQRNLMLTMLLGGLWHGAQWRFVIWGGLHGLYLVGERGLRRLVPGAPGVPRPLIALVTFGLTCIAWVFFRAEGWQDATTLLVAMFGGSGDALALGAAATLNTALLTTTMLIGHWMLRDLSLRSVWERRPWWLRGAVLALLLVAILLSPGSDRAFIYFQF